MKEKMHIIIETKKDDNWNAYGIKNDGIDFLENMIKIKGESKELLDAYYSCKPYIYDDILMLDDILLRIFFYNSNKINKISWCEVGYKTNFNINFRIPKHISNETLKILNKSKNVTEIGAYTLSELFQKTIEDITFMGFLDWNEYNQYIKIKDENEKSLFLFTNLKYKNSRTHIIDEKELDKSPIHLLTIPILDTNIYITRNIPIVLVTNIGKLIDFASKLDSNWDNIRIIFFIERINL